MKTDLNQLENRALKAMMDPHFIFNVINSIQHFINSENKEDANYYLAEFAKLIRISSSFAGKSLVTLEEEIAYLQLYLSFEKLRFGENLSYEIICDLWIEKSKTMIAIMMIQPFLENAIWHGILPTKEKGNVILNIEPETDTHLKITVSDSGTGINKLFTKINLLERHPENLGPCVAIQRLKLLSASSKQDLYIFYKHKNPKQKNKGTIAEFLLPVIYK